MIDLAQVRAQLDTLAAFPPLLRQQTVGLNDTALRFVPTPQSWSIVEIVGHLIDIDALMQGRIGQMISRDNPAFERFDPDEMVRRRDYRNKQLSLLLTTFAEQRATMVAELRYLQAPGLARTGVSAIRGPQTVADLIALLVRHDAEHSAQIAANLAALT